MLDILRFETIACDVVFCNRQMFIFLRNLLSQDSLNTIARISVHLTGDEKRPYYNSLSVLAGFTSVHRHQG